MKSLFTIILSMLLCITAANAQGVHVGAKLGANINKLSGKSFSDEFSFGYHVGGFVEIKLGKRVSIQPEVLFSQITADTTSKFSDLYKGLVNVNVAKAQLHYLSIPLLINYKLAPFLDVQVGPQFGILMDQSKNITTNGGDAFTKGDFSVLGGVQVNLGAVKPYARYSIGLSNINSIDNKDSWKNQTIQIGIGYTFF